MKHLKAFHVFHVAATSCSFSEAATKLCITHGAVSKQIKALEGHLGQTLFHRRGRNVFLSTEGELLRHYTSQAFNALDDGIQQLTERNNQCLEVSCEPTLTMRWLMPRLSDFYAIQTQADIRLSTAGGAVTLGNNGITLAIRRDDFDINPAYHKTPLVEEWVGPVVSAAYWAKIEQKIHRSKRLHSLTRPQAWADWSAASEQQTKPTSGSEQSFLHFYFCLQAAADGLGAAMGSYPLVADDLQRGNLIAPLGFIPSGKRYLLIAQQEAERGSLEAMFSLWVQEQLALCVPRDEERDSSRQQNKT
ncbi:DNA-binding transcriptional LysR family regulator [Sinobacterium caligoides]|uniref:DNA-binding transcriptional LysR family regulator n=1 Tax=Sinobacterium caligoides TaxID=933926 RepID=A0A3N2DRU0_9GAMM|nr:LysR family transcriptional regulator [Sinobacterium caligoides]ROS02025.1 DNA-binding transcriptional LysR family regulator [Sinobacterium caligoides]